MYIAATYTYRYFLSCKAMYIPLVLVPVFLEGASNSKYMVQGDQNRQGLPNMLKHSLEFKNNHKECDRQIKCTY